MWSMSSPPTGTRWATLIAPIYLHDKASHTFEVRLRIDEVVRGAHTTVEPLNDDPELSIRTFDPNLRNNSARIVVNG
jgi:hypothetical protein